MLSAPMNESKRQRRSFLLRLWRAGDGERPEWRLTLEDVVSSESHTFAAIDDLMAFLDRLMEADAPHSDRSHADSGFH